MFERPIPGQSLTTPEKSSPYEKPAEIIDPIDALNVHLDNLNDPEVMEGVLFSFFLILRLWRVLQIC
jgi:hypothetical protein